MDDVMEASDLIYLDGPAESELVDEYDDREIEYDFDDDYSFDYGAADERYGSSGFPSWSSWA